MQTPGSEKFDSTAVRWCALCNGDDQVDSPCEHADAISITCPEPGTLIAPGLEFISMLGVGGMGVVYKCKNIYLDRFVAVKMLLTRRFGSDDVVRFQKEAKAAGRFNHPNLVSVLDFGITNDSEPFMVMEYIEGQTLSDAIESGISFSVLLAVFKDCCMGLAYAHEHGVLHRDLKPENIMIVQTDDGILCKILDFGVAKIADTVKVDHALTQRSVVFGTPPYMSPEQSVGDALTDRSDVYSLGCVIFQALCGRMPFEADSALELIRLHQFENPKLIGEVNPAGDFPEDLEILVSSMLLKKPSDRPSMQAVATGIAMILEALQRAEQETPNESDSLPGEQKSKANTFLVLTSVGVLIGLIAAFQCFQILQPPKIGKPLAKDPIEKTSAYDTADFDEAVPDYNIKRQLHDHQISISGRVNPKTLRLIATQSTRCSNLRFDKCVGMTPENLAILSGMKRLAVIIVQATDLTDEGMFALSKLNNLHSLHLEYVSGIGNPGYDSIKRFRSLKVLSIAGMKIDSRTIKLLSESDSLVELHISENEKFDSSSLAPLEKSHLSFVSFKNSNVDDRAMEALSRIPSLKTVQINHADITDEGVEHLCKAPQLAYVDVSFNRGVTNRSVDSLALLDKRTEKNNYLQFVLNHTSITSESLPKFKKMTHLSKLTLSGKGYTKAVMQDLQRALPNTQVFDDFALKK